VPEELAEFSILHNGRLAAPLMEGDTLYLDSRPYRVLAVGLIANDNLTSLGHVVLKFNGLPEAEMPGDICLEVRDIPAITAGMVLRIEGQA
jgi:PTS system glucitol/sorbitol-specific IIA component